MRPVIIESPYAASTPAEIEANVVYLRAAMRDCLLKGDAPFASHALYTQPSVLRDSVPEERKLGMKAGLSWTARADAVVVYTDRGISKGMDSGIARAKKEGKPVEYRSLTLPAISTPAELAELLTSAGAAVGVEDVLEGAGCDEDVQGALSWARATILFRDNKNVIVPEPPSWLLPFVSNIEEA